MQFEVPQFETETKIFGPFNLIQFITAGGTTVLIIILWNVLQLWLWFSLSLVIGGSVLGILLGKVRGRPMTAFLPGAANFLWQPRTYVYREPSVVVVGLKHIAVPTVVKPITAATPSITTPELTSPYMISGTPAEKPKVIITPKTTPVEPPRETPLLRGLMNRITTTISPIPQRETSVKEAELKAKRAEYEVLERATGEKEVVRRIDYRA